MKKKKLTKKEKYDKAIHELALRTTPPEVLIEAEKLRRKMTAISPEDLFRPFTI